jgi:hypothetical protein
VPWPAASGAAQGSGLSAPAASLPAPPRPIYGRNGRTIDFGGKSAADYIAERSAAARTGDMRAAYDIYQAESACAATQDPPPDFFLDAERQAFMDERARTQALCAGVTPAQLQERLRFLEQAARSGNHQAQIDFFIEGPFGRPNDLEDNGADPLVRQWKEDAGGYLRAAAAQCDSSALGLLANAYDAGQIVPRDPRLVMAYTMAAAVARHASMSQVQLNAQFGPDLGAEGFAQAYQAGTTLIEQNCPGAARQPEGQGG